MKGYSCKAPASKADDCAKKLCATCQYGIKDQEDKYCPCGFYDADQPHCCPITYGKLEKVLKESNARVKELEAAFANISQEHNNLCYQLKKANERIAELEAERDAERAANAAHFQENNRRFAQYEKKLADETKWRCDSERERDELKAERDERDKQEPVLEVWHGKQLFARPVPARSLTDNDIINIGCDIHASLPDDADDQTELLAIARAIEQFLKG